jgi:hypothetical protein
MEEFDYLVNWVKELCDEGEKIQFESAIVADNLPGVWYLIYSKISPKVKDSNSPPNPCYEGLLDLCKKNPTLANPRLECTNDACLGVNLKAVMEAMYPSANYSFSYGMLRNPFVDQQPNQTLERAKTQSVSTEQAARIRNPLKAKFDELGK